MKTKKQNLFTGETRWETDIKVVKKPCIRLTVEVEQKIDALMQAMGNYEWGGYLIGKGLSVTDLVIPSQKVTQASYEVESYEPVKGVIGTIHSHHNMGAFLSKTDEDFLVSNHLVTLVATTNDLQGWVALPLPDKTKLLLEATISIEHQANPSLEKWVQSSLKKIGKQGPAIVTVTTKPQKTYTQRKCFICDSELPRKFKHNVCRECWRNLTEDEKLFYRGIKNV